LPGTWRTGGCPSIRRSRLPGTLFGTVNAGRRHWEQAAEALAAADPSWLSGLITRRVPLTSWTEALNRHPEDIKVVVDLTA
jgi:hypothetical protein